MRKSPNGRSFGKGGAGLQNMVRHMRAWALSALAALQLMTRFPLPRRMPEAPAEFGRSAVFFPLAGLLVGAVLAGAGYALGYGFPHYVCGAFVMALWVLVTGGLHLDGWMDTADGLFSNQSRERMLVIMKDSRVGAMGVMAAGIALIVKTALLAALFADAGRSAFLLLALVPAWSRAFVAAAIAGWPYARKEGGFGGLYRAVKARHAWGAGILAAGLTWLLLPLGGFDPAATLAGLGVAAILAYGTGALLAAGIARKLGGLTGDAYGALNEALELALLAAAAGFAANV